MLYDRLSTKLLIKKIMNGIENNEDIEYFEEVFNVLLQRTQIIASDLRNDTFFRIRLIDNKLFENISELKYPPKEFCKKGRLNDEGEQVAYMSLGEISPLVELDISYYQMYCLVRIEPIEKDTYFHFTGIKGKYFGNKKTAIEVNELMRDILNTKSKRCYNATIALGHLILNKNIIGFNGEKISAGLAYSSVHEDKSNKNLYNVAVNAETFDRKFKIVGAECNVLTYANENIVVETINKAAVLNDGSLEWDKTFDQMLDVFHTKYQNDVYYLKESKGVIHYKYGGGKIIDETADNYLVDFPRGVIRVSKNEITSA